MINTAQIRANEAATFALASARVLIFRLLIIGVLTVVVLAITGGAGT
jgi:hypothetical protein